ncbi:hypothetical protein FRC08_007734 [Ceratobasidium sp. 394]|nr:hypothetical protein FRC08_007734 [Ceratobasidium sp. 394]
MPAPFYPAASASIGSPTRLAHTCTPLAAFLALVFARSPARYFTRPYPHSPTHTCALMRPPRSVGLDSGAMSYSQPRP